MKYALVTIQTELEKRLPYRYKWGQKQNDVWDNYTAFIYTTLIWEQLLKKMQQVISAENLDKTTLFNYAANRWFNFWSAVGIEQIFAEIDDVEKVVNTKDSEKDFYLYGIAFDHKTSVFPKGFGHSLAYALSHKKQLIEWLYQNQSRQKRFHLKNRLFVVVHAKDGNHWKLKANLQLLKTEIKNYASNVTKEQLQSITFANGETALSDIIWVKE